MPQEPDISVNLNSDTFTLEDGRELGERLRSEIDLQVRSGVVAYAGIPGGPAPPDVVLSILHTLIPVADIYANVLASAIWDQARSALTRQGNDDSEVTFSLSERDDDGNVRRRIRGKTRDPETIKELIRQFGKDQQ